MPIESPADSFDELGFLCKIQKIPSDITPKFDGGDSANRTMAYYLAKFYTAGRLTEWEVSEIDRLLDMLECKRERGNYRRHPDSRYWYSECDRMSRDQIIPVMVIIATLGFRLRLRGILRAHLKRGLLFTTNTRRNGATKKNHGKVIGIHPDGTKKRRNYNWKFPDFTGPSIWSIYIRGLNLKVLRPLLFVLDIELAINAIRLRYTKNEKDVINHCVLTQYAKRNWPTPFIWVAENFVEKQNMSERLERFYNGPGLPAWLGRMWSNIWTRTNE